MTTAVALAQTTSESSARTTIFVLAGALLFLAMLAGLAFVSATAVDPIMGQGLGESMIVDASSAIFRVGVAE